MDRERCGNDARNHGSLRSALGSIYFKLGELFVLFLRFLAIARRAEHTLDTFKRWCTAMASGTKITRLISCETGRNWN
jgi:hypothetical protein